MKKLDEVRIGVVGVGGMGTSHVRRIEDGSVKRARITAVCDIDASKMEKFSSGYKKYTDSSRLIRSGEVDAVVIATPHYFHTTIGAESLAAGLHTLTEKPISVHKKDAERLIEAHRNHSEAVFAAMFNQRTNPQYLKLKSLIDGGSLGKISRISWTVTDWFRTQYYYDCGSWRATWSGEGGGVLLNQCPHQLDLFQWLFGMPDTVRAFCGIGKFHEIEVEDSVTAYMEFKNGATAVFTATTGESPGTNRLEIAADLGKVTIEDGRFQWAKNLVSLEDYRKNAREMWGRPEVAVEEFPHQGEGAQHNGIMQNFVDAILDGTELLAPAEEGIKSVELGNSMLYSSISGATVHLPLDGDLYEKELQRLVAESSFRKRTVAGPEGEIDMTASSTAFRR